MGAAEAAKRVTRGKSSSRSRSRSHQRSSAGASAVVSSSGASSSRKADRRKDEGVAVMKDQLLRQAKERGEGWYAAVARASEVWDEEERRRKLARPPRQNPAAQSKDKQGKESAKDQGWRKDRDEV